MDSAAGFGSNGAAAEFLPSPLVVGKEGVRPVPGEAMQRIADLNLIHFLDFYFSFFFLAGTWRRIGQYRSIGGLVLKGPGRWPRLLKLVQEHWAIFLTWPTVLPALLALVLSLVQLAASRALWPEAGVPPYGLTVARLLEHWPALVIVLPLGVVMLTIDIYFLINVGQVDRRELERYFDHAEYWLHSRRVHVVRVFTLGYINPRRMVALEVQKALVDASRLLNSSLWWTTIMVSLRVAFAMSLWLTWALTLP